MDILDNKLGHANVIVLVLEGTTPRFSSGLYDMLRWGGQLNLDLMFRCKKRN